MKTTEWHLSQRARNTKREQMMATDRVIMRLPLEFQLAYIQSLEDAGLTLIKKKPVS